MLFVHRRPADDIVSLLTIKSEDEQFEYQETPLIVSHHGLQPSEHISLPASKFSSEIRIVSFDEEHSQVKIFGQNIVLEEKSYNIDVQVDNGGEITHASAVLKVTNKAPLLFNRDK